MSEIEYFTKKLFEIYRLIESELDEILPDTYNYIQRVSESYIYEENLPFDSYDIRHIANRSFSNVSKEVMQKVDETIIMYISQIRRLLEDKEDLTITLSDFNNEIVLQVRNGINLATSKAMDIFEDELVYEYSRMIDRYEINNFSRRLKSRMENIFEENSSYITRIAQKKSQEMNDEYYIMQRNSKIENEEKKKAQQDVLKQINEIKVKCNSMMQESPEVKEKFSALENYIHYLVNNDVDVRNLDLTRKREFDEIICEFDLAIKAEKQRKEKLEETKEESPKMEDVESTLEPPVQEAETNTDLEEVRQQIDFINSMQTVSDEHKNLIIQTILRNNNLSPEDLETPIENKGKSK